MTLEKALVYTLLFLGAIIGGYTGWASSSDSDYELNTAVAPSVLSFIHERIPAFSIPPPPLPKALTQMFLKKDRTLLVGSTNGFKYVYQTADLNRLSRTQRDAVRAAVKNYFDTHTVDEIDAAIEEGDALFTANGEGSSWTLGTGTACLKLDDKWGSNERWGPIEGYMKIGREEQFDEDFYCGPTFTLTVWKKQFDIVDRTKKAEEEAAKEVEGEDKEVDHEL
ncbi:hypothetical protein BJX66DRAFT_337708 [Aspergillus keveii]|uniref:Uncharacterized protein n=1 Tax=Aspergillus keveii TaxID=714993 RepID=A0ABR4G6B1_9EURO